MIEVSPPCVFRWGKGGGRWGNYTTPPHPSPFRGWWWWGSSWQIKWGGDEVGENSINGGQTENVGTALALMVTDAHGELTGSTGRVFK